jgi:3-oxoacyl-[acyl-carrier protein] reductase
MDKTLEGRVAVVTGSGQGIGRAIAIGFAAQGAKVVTNNRKPGSTGNAMVTDDLFRKLTDEQRAWYEKQKEITNGDAAATARTIRDAGGEATHFFGDIADFETARRLIETAVETYGRIDILCNVAGAFGFSDIENIDEALWDKVNNTKPKGYFNTMRFAVPHMKAKAYGRILNCSSPAFNGDILKHAEYCAANAGVVGLTKGAARELYEFGITCNAFAPFARTRASYELEAYLLASDKPITSKGKFEVKYDATPTPDGLVPFIAYLASERASAVSGSVFTVGGNFVGLHAEPVVTKTLIKESEAPWTPEEIAAAAEKDLLGDYKSPCAE